MPKTLSLLAVLKKIDAKGVKSLSNAQWDTFLASDTEPNEIEEKIKKLEGFDQQGAAYDKTGDLIPEDNNAMIARFRERTGRGVGRESLKVKKSKIDVASFKKDFLNKNEQPVKADTTGTSSLVPSKPTAPDALPEGEGKKEETEGLKGIRDVLDDILKVLRLGFKSDRKEARDAQKDAARDKRNKRENKLEGGLKKSAGLVGKSVKAMMKPFSNIWESLLTFLKFTFLGVLFQKTLKWFSDPKNEKKAKRIGKFFKDWWPALAASAALFLTPLGALITGMTGLLAAIIPKLVAAIAANPWAALAVVGVWGVSKVLGGGGKNGKDEEDEEAGDMEMDVDTTQAHGGGLIQSPPIQNYNEGGVVQRFKPEKSGGFKMGGFFGGGGLVQYFNEGGKAAGVVTDPKERQQQEAYMLKYVNEERAMQGLPPLNNLTYAPGVELTKMIGPGPKTTETSDTVTDLDRGIETTSTSKTVDGKTTFGASMRQTTEEDKQKFFAANPHAAQLVKIKDQVELDNLGDDISASAKMNGGGLVPAFAGGGLIGRLKNAGANVLGKAKAQISKLQKPRVDHIHPPQTDDGGSKAAAAQVAQGSGDAATAGGDPAPGIPNFDAAMMRSQSKIRTLGVSV